MTTNSKRRKSSRAKKAPPPAPGDGRSSGGSRGPATKRARHYTRPGVEAAARLMSLGPPSDHIGKWECAASRYSNMIKAKGGERLAKLDGLRDEMARGWRKAAAEGGGDGVTLSREQLLDVIVEWKFLKGKPRNALRPLLRANSDASVRKAARRAFDAADGIPANDGGDECGEGASAAINCLCVLKGVGPATASAVLCLYRPDAFAFMDDEVIECLYDGKRGYTLKIYNEVNRRCGEIASYLNDADVGGYGAASKWTACGVGKALWTMSAMATTSDANGLSEVFGEATKGEGTAPKTADARKRAKKS